MSEKGTDGPKIPEDFDIDQYNYEEQGIVHGEVRERIAAGRDGFRQAVVAKSARDAVFAEKETQNRIGLEAKGSEASRLEAAVNALGLTKEEFVRHFPALSENYSRIYRERILNGVNLQKAETMSDNMFQLHFGTILSLLESDENLSKDIISTWAEEYGKVMDTFEQIKKRRRA